MASSDTEICNIALGQIGVGRIADIEGVSQVERDCKATYDVARDEVLADFDWPFARKKVELSQLTTTPEFDWSFAYQLPSDCIAVRNIEGREVKYEIVGDQLHCDLSSSCKIVYTVKITNPVKFTTNFVTSLANRLSSYLANAVKKNHKMSLEWLDVYHATLPKFEAADMSKGEDVELTTVNPFVEARL